MNSSGRIGSVYTDRGDVQNPDFTHPTLTIDDTWRDLDLSAIVGTGIKKVEMLFGMVDSTNSNEFKVRQKEAARRWTKGY